MVDKKTEFASEMAREIMTDIDTDSLASYNQMREQPGGDDDGRLRAALIDVRKDKTDEIDMLTRVKKIVSEEYPDSLSRSVALAHLDIMLASTKCGLLRIDLVMAIHDERVRISKMD